MEPNAAPPPPPPSRPPVERPDPDEYPPEVWQQMVEQAVAAERKQRDHDYAFAAYEIASARRREGAESHPTVSSARCGY